MAGTALSYGGNSLQTANIVIENIDHHSVPTITATQYPIDHDNQSIIPYVNYPSKKITVTGYVYSLISIADCDAQIDTFKSLLTGIDLPLVVGYNNSSRTYYATVTDVTITRPGGLLYAPFTITFLCDLPFGQDPNPTVAWNVTSQTTQPLSASFNFTGTAPYQLPIATITYSGTLSGGTNAAVIFSNAGTGQQITVTRTWSSGDVLVIDCTQKTVTVNGIPTAFTGAFPQFTPGSQQMEYSDGFSARTVAINVSYTANYL